MVVERRRSNLDREPGPVFRPRGSHLCGFARTAAGDGRAGRQECERPGVGPRAACAPHHKRGRFLGRHHRESPGYGSARHHCRPRIRRCLCCHRQGNISGLRRFGRCRASGRLDGTSRGDPRGRPARDVRLDPFGHQLYVALKGYGVYATPAPHRFRAPRVASAADFTDRPVAPGALVTVFGASVRSAKAGDINSPVLAATGARSEIQIPFEAKGTSLSLALGRSGWSTHVRIAIAECCAGNLRRWRRCAHGTGCRQRRASGSNAPRSCQLPHSSSSHRTRTSPSQWPSGVPGPVDNPPAVIAPVRAFLDGVPIEVSRASLAPYVGFYIIEIQVPKLVNYGPAELYLEVDGQPSNRVRVYIEP